MRSFPLKRFISILLLVVLFVTCTAAPAAADDSIYIRVLLSRGTGSGFSAKIIEGEYELIDEEEDEVLDEYGPGDTIYINSGCILQEVDEDEDNIFSYAGTQYRGSLRAISNGATLYAVNVIDLEQYLYGVVGKEMGASHPEEALKAQAVVARSYGAAHISSSNKYYDVDKGTNSQVYGGYTAEREGGDAVIDAVDDTYGEVVTYKDKVISTPFCSNAGGHTETMSVVWSGSAAYDIPAVESPYDEEAGNYSEYGATTYQWVVEYTADEMEELCDEYDGTNIGTYKSIKVSTSGSDSGRVTRVVIKGSKGSVTADTQTKIRSLLGLKSTLFTVQDIGNPAPAGYVRSVTQTVSISDFVPLFVRSAYYSVAKAINGGSGTVYAIDAFGEVNKLVSTSSDSDVVVFSGKGYGHGVGLSQWGAICMAHDGYDYDEIIAHYFSLDEDDDLDLQEIYDL